jgi:hypothetical protein
LIDGISRREERTLAIDITATLRQALTRLMRERERVERQIAAIQSVLSAARGGRRRGHRSRKPMSAAARRAVAVRMKAYWAKRRAAKSR